MALEDGFEARRRLGYAPEATESIISPFLVVMIENPPPEKKLWDGGRVNRGIYQAGRTILCLALV